MKLKVVISRYKEDVSWVNQLQYPFCVCNKGIDNLPSECETIKLDYFEHGRETQGYLTFIINKSFFDVNFISK